MGKSNIAFLIFIMFMIAIETYGLLSNRSWIVSLSQLIIFLSSIIYFLIYLRSYEALADIYRRIFRKIKKFFGR